MSAPTVPPVVLFGYDCMPVLDPGLQTDADLVITSLAVHTEDPSCAQDKADTI